MKKFITLALAASMMISMVPATAFATSDLTTTHSNIRVTPGTEFIPSSVSSENDGEGIRTNVPYVVLEANSNFKDNVQTFELALENAEWLETDDDADMLYVEDKTILNHTEDGIKFERKDSDSSSGSDAELNKLKADYETATVELAKAADEYLDAKNAQTRVSLDELKKVFDAALAKRNSLAAQLIKKNPTEGLAIVRKLDVKAGIANNEGHIYVKYSEIIVRITDNGATEEETSPAPDVSDESTPSSGESTPSGSESTPSGSESTPSGSESTPSGSESTPSGSESTPSGSESTPSGSESTPSGSESTPSGSESTPSGTQRSSVTPKALEAYEEADNVKITITKKFDTRIIVKVETPKGKELKDGDTIKIPLYVRTTGGVASVSIDSLDSEFTSEKRTFARTADGDTNLTIEKTQSFYDDDEIKNIFIEELVPGTIKKDGVVCLRVNGDFLLKGSNVKITQITGDGFTKDLTAYANSDCKETFSKGDEMYIKFAGSQSTNSPVQYRITGLRILEDGADFGDEATLTISGGGTTKQTISIGTYEDYGVKLTAEDKELPVIYAGTKASSKFDNETLKVTIEETVANSFIDNRKMELTLPDGVEFVNDSGDISDIDSVTENFRAYNFSGSLSSIKDAFTVDADGGKITISSKDLENSDDWSASGANKDRKRKIEFSLHVAADAAFTGDVVLTLSGAAVADKEISATVATVKQPIEVKTSVNELIIDYRNTDIADITLVEPEAGLWAKDDVIFLEGERMSFEDGAKAEVVSGDMKLKKLDGDNIEVVSSKDVDDGVDVDGSILKVQVDSRSSKTPAEIKLSGLSMYMDRSLAAGDYKLRVFGANDNEFFMNNYDKKGDDIQNRFETAKVVVMNDFVRIVTAGRDQDDSTFTTSIVVPVGSTTIQAGTRTINLSEMEGGACPAAYINNDGYTMLPVRAVTEALNGIAVVRWDDATKTCTVSFGQRVFSMTVGSKVLNMNGVSTALNAAPEIRDSRVFLPLRDLGYALGLSENQISWDAATQTARLN